MMKFIFSTGLAALLSISCSTVSSETRHDHSHYLQTSGHCLRQSAHSQQIQFPLAAGRQIILPVYSYHDPLIFNACLLQAGYPPLILDDDLYLDHLRSCITQARGQVQDEAYFTKCIKRYDLAPGEVTL